MGARDARLVLVKRSSADTASAVLSQEYGVPPVDDWGALTGIGFIAEMACVGAMFLKRTLARRL